MGAPGGGGKLPIEGPLLSPVASDSQLVPLWLAGHIVQRPIEIVRAPGFGLRVSKSEEVESRLEERSSFRVSGTFKVQKQRSSAKVSSSREQSPDSVSRVLRVSRVPRRRLLPHPCPLARLWAAPGGGPKAQSRGREKEGGRTWTGDPPQKTLPKFRALQCSCALWYWRWPVTCSV